MRLLGILLTVLLLASVCLAEKTWSSAPDKLSMKAGDDFQKTTDAPEGTSLALFSEKKNAQLLLTKSGGEVSTDQFIKAFPVLSEEQKFKVESGSRDSRRVVRAAEGEYTKLPHYLRLCG